jgi:hypothetical protein
MNYAELHSLLDIARELNYLEASEVTEIEMPELFVNVSKNASRSS